MSLEIRISRIFRNFSFLPFRLQQSSVNINFRDYYFIESKRSELYGWIDFMANCGGLLGLFMVSNQIVLKNPKLSFNINNFPRDSHCCPWWNFSIISQSTLLGAAARNPTNQTVTTMIFWKLKDTHTKYSRLYHFKLSTSLALNCRHFKL